MLRLKNDTDGENYLEEETIGYISRFWLERSKHLLHSFGHPQDYDPESHDTYEFRIKESGEVQARIIEYTVVVPPARKQDIFHIIVDGKVQEARLREFYKVFWREEFLEKERKKTEWHPLKDTPRLFVLFSFPILFPKQKFNQLVKDELWRIRTGTDSAIAELRRLGASIEESTEMMKAAFPEDEKARMNIARFLTDELAKFAVADHEWRYRPLYLAHLRFWQELSVKSDSG